MDRADARRRYSERMSVESSQATATGVGDGVGGVASATVGIFDGFILGLIHIFQHVVQVLSFADIASASCWVIAPIWKNL